MSLFNFDSITMSCANQEVAASWWEKTFECRRAEIPDSWEDSDDCVALTFPGMEEPTICLSPKARDQNQYPVPIMFTSNIKKAHQKLEERGIAAGPIQGDSRKFFEIRDAEGNTIEISEEP